MFVHAVTLRFKPDAAVADLAALQAGLAELRGRIPSIRRYEFGADAGIGAGNGDFAIVAAFDDVDGYAEYRDHPAHKHLITNLLAPVLDSRTAVQFEV